MKQQDAENTTPLIFKIEKRRYQKEMSFTITHAMILEYLKDACRRHQVLSPDFDPAAALADICRSVSPASTVPSEGEAISSGSHPLRSGRRTKPIKRLSSQLPKRAQRPSTPEPLKTRSGREVKHPNRSLAWKPRPKPS